MTRRGVLIAVLLTGTVVGLGGYLIVSAIPLLGGIGAASAVALLIVAVAGPDRPWTRAEDLRRADDQEERPMPQGPAPPFQT
jgi:hypothetical protein